MLCLPIGRDEASRSQNSREFLVYLWSELIILSGMDSGENSAVIAAERQIELKRVFAFNFFLTGTNWPNYLQKYAIFLSNFRSIIDNFFLNANIFTETKFLQNLVNTSDWVFSKIIKCISVETLDSVFIRKITKKACLHPLHFFAPEAP
jgi:hypothetical protein